MFPVIEILKEDITTLNVDAIVNAARPSLLGGGGVDGAIHRAAGLQLRKACEKFPEVTPGVRCRTGEVFLTSGYDLPAKHILHTVGPVYDETLIIPEREYLPPETDKDALLYRCYVRSLELAFASGFRTVAFPAISCGVYGCPIEKGVELALTAFLAHRKKFNRLVLVLFTDLEYEIALTIWQRMTAGDSDPKSLEKDTPFALEDITWG